MCNYLCCFLLGCCCLVALEEEEAIRRSQEEGMSMAIHNHKKKIFLVSVEKNKDKVDDKNNPVAVENSS